MIKKIIYIVIAIIALPLIIALFLKKEYHVERSVTVDKSQSEVYHFLRYTKNHKKFTAWSQYDPNQKETYKGTDGQVGYIQHWESDHEKVGVGEMEIVKLSPNTRIDYAFRFYEPFKALNDSGYFALKPITSDNTEVTWGYDGKMNYPSNLLILFLNFEELIGDDFEKGLNKLKTIL